MSEMRWTEVKKDIQSISEDEKNVIELMASLASIRKSKHMTQQDVAEKAQLSQVQIAKAETLAHTPSIETVVKIANSLNLELTFVDKSPHQLTK
ncbi:helix-turn-helix transcriptional regulator [Desemzia sp. C1]|uniref:helix-turn-helix domain-containing protein n=1 Tax=Desemzia sp. C1 TaxID=2892016 RepID=UPI001E656D9D|nr:helix-turn-helix transcriptional regulator [Desemzia sp. C1]MCI3028209.1 helix-turn-helix transcriptional regulator [Desemzia sp. C1]